MNKTFVASVALLLTLFNLAPAAYASRQGAPFIPEVDARFDCIESGFCTGSSYTPPGFAAGSIVESKLQALGNTGLNELRVAKATWSFAANGGAISTIPLGVTIPANATMIRSWIYIKTAVTGTSTGTIAFKCANANDIFTATDETGSSSDTFVEGVQTGTAANFKKVTTACVVSIVIATQAMTAGVVDAFVEYVVHS